MWFGSVACLVSERLLVKPRFCSKKIILKGTVLMRNRKNKEQLKNGMRPVAQALRNDELMTVADGAILRGNVTVTTA